MAKESKPRAEKYEPKLAVKEGTTFETLINTSLGLAKKKPAPKKKKG